MPKQGQSVESCILTEMKKKKGDSVAVGDILFSYETDKASFEEEAQVAGTVLDVFFDDGDEIPVLTNVMVIGNEGESTAEFRPGGEAAAPAAETPVAAAAAPAATPAIAAAAETAVKPATTEEHFARIAARPRTGGKKAVNARRAARFRPTAASSNATYRLPSPPRPNPHPVGESHREETGAAAPEAGSGLAGMVKGADMGALKNSVYATDSEIKPLTNMRKLIAKAMHASLQNSAQLTHHLSADARRILELRKKVKKAVDNGYPTNITLNDMVCMAVIKALKKFPQVNSHFLGDSTRVFSKVHLGLAVDTDRGLMVPTVKNADDLSIQGLANQLKEVANACKKGSIDPDLLSSEAASFTVSNLGNYGVEIFTPVINLPQVAILGVNTIVPRPKDIGGGVYAFVPHIGLSLTYDHRALDGGEATRFVKEEANEIEAIDFEL